MRIGVVTTGYPHRGDCVAGAFVRAQCLALVARGHRVDVVCAARPSDVALTDDGITIHPVRYGTAAMEALFYDVGAPERLAHGMSRAWLGAAAFPFAAARVARSALGSCDALISHFVLPSAWIAGRIADGRTHLAIGHGSDVAWLARTPAAAQRAVLRHATHIQFTHAAARNSVDASALERASVHVRPMGVTTRPMGLAERRAARSRLGVRGFCVATVARLIPLKGVDGLVDAIALLARDGIEATLLVAGDGPERSALEARARGLGSPARFLGAVDSATRDDVLAACDVFALASRVLPSGRTDAAPVALMEAMAARRAVVATRVGGLPDVVADAGTIVPPDDAPALAHAIGAFALDPGARDVVAERAGQRAAQWHWDAQAEWLDGILRE